MAGNDMTLIDLGDYNARFRNLTTFSFALVQLISKEFKLKADVNTERKKDDVPIPKTTIN